METARNKYYYCVWGYCRRLEKKWKRYDMIIPIGIQNIITLYFEMVDEWNDKTMSKGWKFMDGANAMVVKHTKTEWNTIFGTVEAKESFSWKIKIKHMTDSTYAIFIGVIDAKNEKTFDSGYNNYIGGAVGYAYNSYGYTYHNNKPVKYGAKYSSNDIIGIYLDTKKRTLSFSKNDTKFDVAFNLPKAKRYKLAVTSYYQNDEIQLL